MNIQKLEQYILCPTQKILKKYLTNELQNNGYTPISKKGFLYAPGKFPILLCAHLDTVLEDSPKKIIRRYNYLEAPNGIGGDDRCGIFIIMELIRYFNCSVLFLEDEETGGKGAQIFSHSTFCSDVKQFNKYIVEFDRRGGRDAVFYKCHNLEFEDFVLQRHYFQKKFGTFSDISIIAPAVGLAAVNLSAGYYNEHTANEYINLQEVDNIINESRKLLAVDVVEPYEYIHSEYSYFCYYD